MKHFKIKFAQINYKYKKTIRNKYTCVLLIISTTYIITYLLQTHLQHNIYSQTRDIHDLKYACVLINNGDQ